MLGVVDKGFNVLKQAAAGWPLLSAALSALTPSLFDSDPAAACAALQNELNFGGLNTTILNATYFHNISTVDTLGVCRPTAHISTPLCRVQFVVNTSNRSAVTAEAWLPRDWSGRFLALGNGGLGGCIDYNNLAYGASYGFATVASNNGHDGNTGKYFHDNSEVLEDFTSRSIHVETVIGKRLVAAYYGRAVQRSYYLGCSTGGRQGIYAALYHPDDFDGILAGAPATNFNYLSGWSAMLSRYVGAPDGAASPSFIPARLWKVIGAEILRQCDALDDVVNGEISEPDACEFRPEELQCTPGHPTPDCLTYTQVDALRKIYTPLHGPNGEWLFPRLDPGAELSPGTFEILLSGKPPTFSYEWSKYVVNKTDFDFSRFGLHDVVAFQATDKGNISTFNGDLSAFRARGGKLITYHGRSDGLIPSGNTKAFYNLIAHTLGLRASQIDEFYRLFLIPGMGHCSGYGGACRFGQDATSIPQTQLQPILQLQADAKSSDGDDSKIVKEALETEEREEQSPSSASENAELRLSEEPESDNILLRLVDWVEQGNAPDTIRGEYASVGESQRKTRLHCRYPQRSIRNGTEYICVT